MTRRTEKVADLVQTTVAELIARRVKDPVVADSMISITRVEVAADLSTARLHISLLESDNSYDPDTVVAALGHAEPFLHRELAKALHMRRVPRLRFLHDPSIAEGDRITALMRDVARQEGRDL